MSRPILTGTLAHCSACGRVFSSPTHFAAHQRMPSGQVECLDPTVLGMVVRRFTEDGTEVWGRPRRAFAPDGVDRKAA